MKREWTLRMQDFLVIVMNHVTLIAAAITIMGIFGKPHPQTVLWTLLIIVPILLYFIRRKIEKIVWFYGIHFLMLIGIIWYQAEQLTKVLFSAIVLFYIIWSIKLKMTSKSGKQGLLPAPFFVSLMGIMVLLNGTRGTRDWEIYYLVIALVYLIGYFFYYFMEKYMQFITMNEKSASNIPEKTIFFAGMRQTAMFSLGSVFILILTANLDWFTKMMSKIGEWFLNILRAIFAGVEFYVEEEPEKALPEDIAQSPGGFHGDLIPEFVLEIIQKLVTIIAYVVFMAFIFAVIWYIYKFVRENFISVQKKKTRKLRDNEDIRENCGVESRKKREGLTILLNNRDKIRKIYRKRILKGKMTLIGDVDQKQLEFLTAKECCDKLAADKLKNVYEKARYSAEEITAEDVKLGKMKV